MLRAGPSRRRPLRESRLRIVVLGYIIRGPIGGMAWHHLQYVRGLVDLGHDVLFLEDSDDYPSCYDPQRSVTDTDPAYGLAFADHAFARLGLAACWAYHDAHRGRWHGPAADRAPKHARSAELLLNISGVNPLRDWLREVPRRVLIDTDPLFTQARHLQDPQARSRACSHNVFFTFGENIPRGESDAPDDGLPWQPTRQPVVLEAWPVTPPPAQSAFTTVMQWDSYSECVIAGRRYGMKSRSFEPYLDLPRLSGAPLELALGSSNAPRQRLNEHGWRIVDPLAVTRDPWTYQRYLQRSAGEFSIAKHGYVAARTGWFSERSACYLASGRPVIVQDTGFTAWLPIGQGLHAFNNPDEAALALKEVLADHARHAAAARELAEAYFDSRRVLTALLDRASNQPLGQSALKS